MASWSITHLTITTTGPIALTMGGGATVTNAGVINGPSYAAIGMSAGDVVINQGGGQITALDAAIANFSGTGVDIDPQRCTISNIQLGASVQSTWAGPSSTFR